jgi:hypothetical protein
MPGPQNRYPASSWNLVQAADTARVYLPGREEAAACMWMT